MPFIRQTIQALRERAKLTPQQRKGAQVELMRHYRETFGTISGQIVLADLLRRCKVLGLRGTPQEEGAAGVGLHVVEMITRDPDDLLRFVTTSETGELFNERDAAD